MNKNMTRNKELLGRALMVIPRASQTMSKAPDQFVRGVSPFCLERANGCYVFDVDGNKYIDLASSLGAIILGYRHPDVEEAIRKQRKLGTIFSLPGEPEIRLAEKLVELLPHVDMVRFGLNGSDVTTAAIRVARAYTGRDHIAKCGYHGWPDWTIASNPLRSAGVPQSVKNLTHEFKYNDLESLEKILDEYNDQIAAVILEPVSSTMPNKGFLEGVRRLATKHKAILVFDELVTGFRLSIGGAAEYFNVRPDLVCYGKAVSNGEPLSVLGGKREIMRVLERTDVFCSFTYAGFLSGVAAAMATLEFMQRNKVQEKIWKTGDLLMNNYNSLAEHYGIPTKALGFGPHPVFTFKNVEGDDDLALKSLFIQETAKSGILTNCSVLMNYSHNESHVKKISREIDSIFSLMKDAIRKGKVGKMLEGPMIKPRGKPA